MFDKLTYYGTECNNYLYFSFDSEFFNTDMMTKELGIEPTSLMIKKDPIPKSTAWKYKIEVGNEITYKGWLKALIRISI